jgi:hypothetical protein
VAKKQRVWPCHAMAATGSYDHTVRLWNMEDIIDTENKNQSRTDTCRFSFTVVPSKRSSG